MFYGRSSGSSGGWEKKTQIEQIEICQQILKHTNKKKSSKICLDCM